MSKLGLRLTPHGRLSLEDHDDGPVSRLLHHPAGHDRTLRLAEIDRGGLATRGRARRPRSRNGGWRCCRTLIPCAIETQVAMPGDGTPTLAKYCAVPVGLRN